MGIFTSSQTYISTPWNKNLTHVIMSFYWYYDNLGNVWGHVQDTLNACVICLVHKANNMWKKRQKPQVQFLLLCSETNKEDQHDLLSYYSFDRLT